MTVETRHTPGPWSAGNCGESDPNAALGYPPGDAREIVARVYGFNPAEADANARLIAAAPALLDALETLTRCAELGIPPYASLVAARAAIAQARGEA